LGSKYGAEVWEALSDEEVRTISLAMSSLGTIDVEIVEKLMLQFTSQMAMAGALTGNYESTERLLSQFLPQERVAAIMEEIRGPAGRTMWEKLSNVQDTMLAAYLKIEHPQTVAVILSKLKSDHAA